MYSRAGSVNDMPRRRQPARVEVAAQFRVQSIAHVLSAQIPSRQRPLQTVLRTSCAWNLPPQTWHAEPNNKSNTRVDVATSSFAEGKSYTLFCTSVRTQPLASTSLMTGGICSPRLFGALRCSHRVPARSHGSQGALRDFHLCTALRAFRLSNVKPIDRADSSFDNSTSSGAGAILSGPSRPDRGQRTRLEGWHADDY